MFGHISPPGLYRELQIMANLLDPPRLDGLRVFVTHIKESLIPHPSGRTMREIVMAELRELDGLGVEFVEVKRGDRIGEPKCVIGADDSDMTNAS
jgi:cAMP phosphodiesterase